MEPERIEQKRSAIFHTGVVGYNRLIGARKMVGQAAIIFASSLSVAFGGAALAQSHDHDAKAKPNAVGAHGSMSHNTAESEPMKKMAHAG